MSINRNKTLEEQIRKLKRDMNAILRKLDEMDKRFDRLESKIDKVEIEIKDEISLIDVHMEHSLKKIHGAITKHFDKEFEPFSSRKEMRELCR